ncbi:MAG: DUF6263 family protein [Psychroserpens sp.]|uniref:DUF6263 family protein n=1 Tax=Psychroserpens sp. TaxID=2020870 RepID=UPI0030036AF9
MKLFITKFLVAFIITTNVITEQTNLTYNLEIGSEFKAHQVVNQDIVKDMNDQKHEIKNLLEGDLTFIIQGVIDSAYEIKFKFDRFKKVATSNPFGELCNINTEDTIADDAIEGKIFSQLTSTDLSMIMYKNGKIKAITGKENLLCII